MISLTDARATVMAALSPLPVVTIDHVDAAGAVLAADVIATENVPPFDNTAVDGYAVRAIDVVGAPCELRVVGELAAGAAPSVALSPGTAIRIMTGAPIPHGCDAVVMVEDTERLGDDAVRVVRGVAAGAAIRSAGSDVRAGDIVFRAGTSLNAAAVGVLAAINARSVTVHKRPRVAVLSTGDELVDDGSPLRPGQIRESNRVMLRRLIEDAGCLCSDLGIVVDDEQELERVLREAVHSCDAVVTSGGVSMGDYDVVKAVLGRIAAMSWMQIAMKPAKPFAFGTLRHGDVKVPIFGLPGNPVSSLVSFELLARPALRFMAGHSSTDAYRHAINAIVDADFPRSPDGKVHFDRVVARWQSDGRLHVVPVEKQGSHQLAATALANALLEVPDGTGLKKGDTAVAFLMSGT